jgi:hypothetical protein
MHPTNGKRKLDKGATFIWARAQNLVHSIPNTPKVEEDLVPGFVAISKTNLNLEAL